ncbi:Acg family FMN-binding oxidoreductase [Streptomyces sp. TRM68416]|uniref:Acg family FMN-binding oxidoreductase n=1 Tax=Streptomyces sp. TRM68416 TaxID=2758412 RepID=UPI001661C796|nr:nitroreductase family protein [Streptomyces sp. TRM68416]MBD0842027.1 nitroreductase family protein [Streptomyces sp. TRM68416]
MRSTSLDAVALETCVAAAVAAPSLYNSQPWRFRLDPETVTFHVRAAPAHGLRFTDPEGRALHISVGACVLNLRVALEHFGWAPVIRLLPSPRDPTLLATVNPTESGAWETETADGELYAALWRRRSSRLPFSDDPLPLWLRAELAAAAEAEGASLVFPQAAETARLLELTALGERRNHADPDRAAESRRWVREDPYSASDTGVPLEALGPQDARERLPMRDFTAQRHPERLPARSFEKAPVIALLTTEHDRRADWLRAGQALERVLLVATARGLRTSLLHQALEWPDLRASLSPTPDHTGHAQILVRLGHGPQGPATPRRPAPRLLD